MRSTQALQSRWGRDRRRSTGCRMHPSALQPGFLTTTRAVTRTSYTSLMDILRRPYTRRHPRQHHALLVDEYGDFFGSSLLGEQVRLFRRERLHPGCRERLSRRALSSPAQLGRAGVPQPHLLQRARQGRPFRGLGAAGTLLVGGPSCVQITSLALLGGCDFGVCPRFSGGLEVRVAAVVADGLVDDSQGVTQGWWRRWAIRGQQWGQEPVVELGVEDREASALGGEHVGVAAG